MAYGGASRQRSNFGRFQKQATIYIKKALRKTANTTLVNLDETISEKLLETYKTNVEASYHPITTGSYEHTGKFLENIDVKNELDPGIGRDRIRIVLKNPNETYPPTMTGSKKVDPHVVTVKQVYEFLTEGTRGGGDYWFTNEEGDRPDAHNHPMPAHLFEQHTQLQMKAFMEGLEQDIKKGKYSRRNN